MRFSIRLQQAHARTGLTCLQVEEKTGVSRNTVRRYAQNAVVVLDHLPSSTIVLAKFYGVDWRDDEIVDVIENGNKHE